MCDLIIFIVQCSNGLCYALYCEPINKITMKIAVSMFTCPMPTTKKFVYIC